MRVMTDAPEHYTDDDRRHAESDAVKQRVTDVKEPLWKVTSPFLHTALFAFVAHDTR